MPVIKLLKTKRDPVPTIRKGKYQEIYQDKRWRRLRAAKLRANPLCERCEARGRVTPTEEVHHKIPFDQGTTAEEIEELAFDWDNLMSVCDPCHNEEHEKIKNSS
jgi:5-methylcytosine-specific restriction protein A